MPTPEELLAEASRLEAEAAAQLSNAPVELVDQPPTDPSSSPAPTDDLTPPPAVEELAELSPFAKFIQDKGWGGLNDDALTIAFADLLSDKASAEITDPDVQRGIEEFMRAHGSNIVYTWKAF